MATIARTPTPPYYAVIFTSERSDVSDGYADMAKDMMELVQGQPGFLGVESAPGITISYWRDLASIRQWKENERHQLAQANGKAVWYDAYQTRICKVERDYGFHRET
ncbi:MULTISPECIES: antibiotic biosynthesis monooxygenase family protein [Alicyclobacillus]|uniref:Antibiotic biosynthesis monooxygenase n=1 Tax=Alicyclobacillus acidoterrestris (strain ATCC 49025 / DSM 3922 / CIP 106132 / NCIMB 13137 / GD3B) TaxID=1356854 RepID=T0BQL6_ALIAG|nr:MULTISPECIES: antibiotic biosynthesis monooxygenase [Alicyclobacillus]EPZ46323.1 hypothetical protein N007_06580 [Alicyclobacillus acidoterrestris ATCC 49025]UNO49005.1 antibiotic biosynthesis monooxygenase [Alicyclobacillus acidoterrestris]